MSSNVVRHITFKWCDYTVLKAPPDFQDLIADPVGISLEELIDIVGVEGYTLTSESMDDEGVITLRFAKER